MPIAKFLGGDRQASRTYYQQLLASLNFALDTKNYSVVTNESDFYELWQQHK